MANFVISTVVGSINSKKNSIINTFKHNPLYSLFNDEQETWKKDKISPRLNDLTVQKSSYNEIIPVLYGTNRIAGNIIWATDIKEIHNNYTTTYRTGKGGKKIHQNNIEYYYYANIAIGICKGKVSELKRVWADTDLIDLSKYTYRFYNGSEDQAPDILIQSVQGIGRTPAYKGLCYIVFENLPLNEFGNRIPNFTFEITRNFIGDNEVENLITGVNLIPGCGEFVYDTQTISKEHGVIWYGKWHSINQVSRINQNNNSGIADAIVATQQLKNSLPHCEWVAPVVVWFGNSTNISDCIIEPRVEFKVDPAYPTQITTPEEWGVAGLSRSDANIVSNDADGRVRYGGTVSDSSVIRYVQYLKKEGFNVMFYPMMFIDIENKPWRGYLSGDFNKVKTFFEKPNGYNRFILHYANLVKDYVDAFIIGSEMRNLTKITDGNGNFPAVDCLMDLANRVRGIVGANVKIGYAADWSEYHHTDGGWYNMDKLWASKNIDFVGIDAYFPLTDKKESLISKDDIINGWTSGEGYDWLYIDSDRTKKVEIKSEWAWKNIEWWWKNEHVNPDGNKTDWIPKGKKIWFTEYGFASVDGTTNEPNKFYDAKSIDGGFPRFSEGKIDYFAQRKAIQATEEKWLNSPMVEQKFLWCWDTRPYPFFPNKLSVWSDGSVWHYGHWINGKLWTLIFSNMIKMLFEDAAIDFDSIGDIDIYDSIDGIVLNNKVSVNEVLNILQKIFFFDYYEKDGKLYITSKKTNSSLRIDEGELIELEKGIYFKSDIIGENELPCKLDVSYINKDLNYQVCNTYSERNSVKSYKKESESLPVVINDFKAKQIAEKLLYSTWLERIVYNFKLPPQYMYLNPSDVIILNINNTDLVLRIVNILFDLDNTIEIKAVKCDNSLYNFKKEEEKFDDIKTIMPTGKTNIEVFELPAIKNTEYPEVFFATSGNEKGWNGCGIYSAKTGSNNFNIINESRINSIVGTCLNRLGDARPYYFDNVNELFVFFNGNIDTNVLETIDLFDLLDGGNLALIGNEIIQFEKVELQENGSFRISKLLRGQYGTEEFISNHLENEKFIFIDKGLITSQFTSNDIGMSYDFKAITFNDSFENSTDRTLKIVGKNLLPMKPVHVKCNRIDDGYRITWESRERGNHTWKDGEEFLPSKEYLIEILDENGAVVRRERIRDIKIWVYTDEMVHIDNANNWKVDVIELTS